MSCVYRRSLPIVFLIILICSSIQLFAADLTTLHQQALDAFAQKDWKNAAERAGTALQIWDSTRFGEWSFYDPDRSINEAEFLGDFTVVKKQFRTNSLRSSIEILETKSGKSIKTIKTSDYRSMYNQYLTGHDYRIVYSRLWLKDMKDWRLIILRSDRISFPLDLSFDCKFLQVLDISGDMMYALKVGEKASTIFSINTISGELKDLTELRHVTLEAENYNYYSGPWMRNFRYLNDKNCAFIIDSSRYLRLNYTTNQVADRGELPPRLTLDGIWHAPNYYFLRNDIDSLLRCDFSQVPHSITTFDISTGSKSSELLNTVLYDNDTKLARIIGDSLYLNDLNRSGTSKPIKFSVAGRNLHANGKYLINSGDQGLRVFDGNRPVYDVTGALVHVAIGNKKNAGVDHLVSEADKSNSTMLYYYRSPGELIAYDLKSQTVMWRKPYRTLESEGRLYQYDDRYLWLHGASIGTQYLIDARDGSTLYMTNNHWGMEPAEISSNGKWFFAMDNWEVPLFEMQRLSSDRKLLRELAAVAIVAQQHLGTDNKASQYLPIAMQPGEFPTTSLRTSLFEYLQSKKLVTDANRIAWESYLATGENSWKSTLQKHGLSVVTEPFMEESHTISVQNKTALVWNDWGREDYIARDRLMKRNTVRLDDGQLQVDNLPMLTSYSLNSQAGPIYFTYSKTAGKNDVVWTPNLFSNDGSVKTLQPIKTTYLDPSVRLSDSRIHWWIPSGTAPNKDGYLLGEFLEWGMKPETDRQYTFGINIDGVRPGWCDTTSDKPVKSGEHFYVHTVYGRKVVSVNPGGQAEQAGIKKDDIVIGLGSYHIGNNSDINDIKKCYQSGEKLDLKYLRGKDTLITKVKNGMIGFNSNICKGLSEIDPRTGKQLANWILPDGFHYACCNTEGTLIYQKENQLYFFDPARNIARTTKISGLDEFYMGSTKSRLKTFWLPLQTNKIALHGENENLIGIDLATGTNDVDRILWKKDLSNLHDAAFTDDPLNVPIIMKNGELQLLNQASGEIVFHELLPFGSIADPVVRDGVLYGNVEGRLVGWKIGYYKK